MYYFYLFALIISIILFVIISLIKKKRYLWIFFFSLALVPFIGVLLGSLYSFFEGTGLVGDYGGFKSALFVIVITLIYQWYFFIPAFIVLCISIYNLFIKKEHNDN